MKNSSIKQENLSGLVNFDLGGVVKPIAILVGIGGAVYLGKKQWDKYKESQAEKSLDTEEGRIALQLKNVFDATIVSDSDYKRVALQINSSNKDKVYSLYKALTQRNLSDDIAAHINTDTLMQTNKTEVINSKPNGVIRINANDDIEFLVTSGSKVRFTIPQKAVNVYAFPEGLLYDMADKDFKPKISELQKVKATISNRTDVFTVTAVKILPYNGVKLAKDWTKYFRPVVSTRKVYAIVRFGLKDKAGKMRYMWCDARDLSLVTSSSLKGYDTLEGLTNVAKMLL
jgi:hypothetical protein